MKVSKNNWDFRGYATRADLKCSDGRTILKDAFKHQDQQVVPLVWQHLHNDPGNILGHALLENREDGVYCYAKFNETPSAQNAKELVRHGDINSLSIWANGLKEKSNRVMHGMIREVSLVLSGANPGAVIENLSFAHGDGSEYIDDSEAIIYSGEDFGLEHAGESGNPQDDLTIADVFDTFTPDQKTVVYAMLAHALGEEEGLEGVDEGLEHADEKTVNDVFNSFTPEQKNVVYYLIGAALEEAGVEDDNGAGTAKHSNLYNGGDNTMKHNVFDNNNATKKKTTLSHDQMVAIVDDAKRFGSLKEAFLAHADTYGFDPIDVLFPDAHNLNADGPQLVKRDDTWVEEFLNATTKTPFARIKTVTADITADEARAKGYVTGNLKKDEIVRLMKRTTSPTTIYKKQKIDRDDMVDITDFDVVAWLKREMRGMLNEELARAILIGDGRDVAEEDKINEQCIRPIALDNDSVYIHRGTVDNDEDTDGIIDAIIRNRKYYKGTGTPNLYTSTDLLTEMLLIKDTTGRRIYKDVQELASVLRVNKIIEVELMNDAERVVDETTTNEILGIMVNPKDYTIGANNGGQVAMFDDFDIDFNQHKYLIETRCSGALTKPKSAIIFERKPAVGG